MNILQIGTMDNKGGAAMVSWHLKKELEKLGHKMPMIVGYKRSKKKNIWEIYDQPINNFISRIIKRNFRARLQYNLAYYLGNDIAFLPGRKIKNRTEFKTVDLIHAHNLHSDFFNLKSLTKLSHLKPFIWTLHDMWALTGHCAHSFDCSKWQEGCNNCPYIETIPAIKWDNTKHLWNLKKKIYDKSKLHIVAPSKWLYKKVKRGILKNHPVSLIYNGVDTNRFAPISNFQFPISKEISNLKSQIKEELNLPIDKKIILFASKGGHKNPWKGWKYADDLIKKFKNNKNILFLCLGGYDSEGKEQNIKSVNYISHQGLLAKYYQASDLLLYPSLADNCPLTVLEAMACGLPVLTFNTGGIPELVIHKQNGYVAEYKNQADLNQGFERLINLSTDEFSEMSSSCRQRVVKNFSLEKMVNEYFKLYQQISK